MNYAASSFVVIICSLVLLAAAFFRLIVLMTVLQLLPTALPSSCTRLAQLPTTDSQYLRKKYKKLGQSKGSRIV